MAARILKSRRLHLAAWESPETTRTLMSALATTQTRLEGKGNRQIQERVAMALRKTGYPIMDHISISIERNRAVLRGKVPSFYMKQVAQTTVMKINGVASVQNELVVT